jgi:DNA polymerase-3 subunit delta
MTPPAKRTAAAAPVSEANIAASRAVLALGAEAFLAERVVSTVVAAARATEPLIEVREVDLSRDEALGTLVEACSPNLFGDAAVVVIRSVDAADEVMIQTIIGAARDGEVRLIALHPSGVRGKKVADALKAAEFTVAPCEKLKGRAVEEFIARELKNLKRTATPDAIHALRTAVGDDPRALASSLAQLSSDVEQDPIDVRAVGTYHEGVSDVPGYLVSDALLGGRAVEVLRLTRWALNNDPNAGPALSGAVAAGLRGMARVASAPRGASEAEVAKEAGVPPFKVRSLRELSARWHPSALAAAIVNTAIADAAVKGRAVDGRQMAEQSLDKEQGTYVLEQAFIEAVSHRSR